MSITTFATNFTFDRDSVLLRLARVIYQWQARAEQRQALAELDDRMLRDIGVDRVSANLEAAKPFWLA